MRIPALITLMALLFGSFAQAILIDERTGDPPYLEAANQVSATCHVLLITDAQGSTSSGTGVLISQNLVLTAAHVVEGMCATGIVRFGANDGSGEQVRRIKAFYKHPGFVAGPFSQGVDLAILVLDAPVMGIEPVPLSPPAHFSEQGFMVCVGYGKTGTLSAGINTQYHSQLAKMTESHVRDVCRYLKPGLMVTHAEKMNLLTRSLTGFSRPLKKRMAVIPVQPVVWEGAPTYYVMHAPIGRVPETLPHPLYGTPQQGDSGAGLLNSAGHLVGILNHISQDQYICFLDLRPYTRWIEDIMEANG